MPEQPRPASVTAGEAVLAIDGISASRVVFLGCLLVEVGFVFLDYHVNFGRLTESGAIRRLMNIAREDGLASWFAATQTLMIGLTAWVFWAAVRARGVAGWRRSGWMLVAVLFTYMALDDGAQIHERVGTAFGELGVSRFPSFSWQPLFVPLFGLLGLGSALFLWSELRTRFARSLIASAFLLFAIAIGLDFLEGLEPTHRWNIYAAVATRYDIGAFTQARFRQTPYETLVHFSRSAEEFFEMLATTCLWTAMLRHSGAILQEVRLRNADRV